MPIHRIEVAMKQGLADPAGEALCARVLEDLNIHVENARVLDVYTLNASLDEQELEEGIVGVKDHPGQVLKLDPPHGSHAVVVGKGDVDGGEDHLCGYEIERDAAE